jgi:hypothetical protein
MSGMIRYVSTLFAEQSPIVDRLEENLLNFHESITSAQTRTEVTFWGKRVVCLWVDGRVEKVSLDRLDSAIWRVGRWENVQGFDAAQRVTGMEIATKLEEFRVVMDAQIREGNFLTRIFVWLREFEFHCGRVAPDRIFHIFRIYTRSAAIQTFQGHAGVERLSASSYESNNPLYEGAVFPVSGEPTYWIRAAHIQEVASGARCQTAS